MKTCNEDDPLGIGTSRLPTMEASALRVALQATVAENYKLRADLESERVNNEKLREAIQLMCTTPDGCGALLEVEMKGPEYRATYECENCPLAKALALSEREVSDGT